MQDICKFSNIILCYTELSMKADKMQRNELRCVYVTLADFIIVSGKILIQLGLNQRLDWGRFWGGRSGWGKCFVGFYEVNLMPLFFFRWIWCLVTCKSQHFAARLKSRTTALLQIVILLLLGCFASSVYANYTHDSNEFWEGTSRLFYEHVFVGKFQYAPGPRKHALQLRDCEKLLPKSLTPNYLHTVTLSLLIIMLFENMKQHHRLIRWELLRTRDYPHTTVQLAHS